jgi:sugar phosphate isomerase/epimerase
VRACALAPGPPSPAPEALAAVLRPAGARVVAVEASPWSGAGDPGQDHGGASLVSVDRDPRARAVEAARRAAAVGRVVGARDVVLRLGDVDVPDRRRREQKLLARLREEGPSDALRAEAAAAAADADARAEACLDRACRVLFELRRVEPETRFAVATPASPFGFPSLRALPLLLDDLRDAQVGYWHDSGAARLLELLGLSPPLAFAGEAAERTFGASFHDVAGTETHLPPGAGEIDFKALRDALPSGVAAVLDVDARFPLTEVKLAAALLESLRF